MLLNEIIKKLGDYCFDNRGLQFLSYILVILVEIGDLNNAVESIPHEIFCFAVALSEF